jgi:nitroreductase
METLETILTRRSIRSFTEEAVPLNLIRKILEAGGASPSGGNAQAWTFIIVQFPRRLACLRSLAPGIIGNPTAVLVICLDEDRITKYSGNGGEKFAWMDIGFATQNILLAVHDLGLGACPVGSFNPGGISLLLDLPKGISPILILALGYSNQRPKPPSHLSISEFCFMETWGKSQ